MFQNEMKEAETGFAEILGIKPTAGEQCLEFIYTGEIEFSEENAKDLIHAAEMMQLHGLLGLYFEYSVEGISLDNCLEYMELATTYNKPSFGRVFKKFIVENFGRLIEAESFRSISQQILEQILELRPDGSRYLEKLKLEAVKIWVDADKESRNNVFPELFQLIKLNKFSNEFLRDVVANEDLVCASPQCQRQIYEVWKKNAQPCSSPTVNQSPLTHILTYHEESRLLIKYDRGTKTWSRFTRVPKGLVTENTNVFSRRGEIYLASASGLTKFANGSWTKVLDTGFGDGYCKITSHNEILYLVAKTFHFECNVGKKSYIKHEIPEDLQLGFGFAIAASDECLYALGGGRGGRNAIEFNFSLKLWEPVSCMQYSRTNGNALFYNGTLLAIGGRDSSSVEYYEPSIDKWFILPKSDGKNHFDGTNCEIFRDGEKLLAMNKRNLRMTELKLDIIKKDIESISQYFAVSGIVRLP